MSQARSGVYGKRVANERENEEKKCKLTNKREQRRRERKNENEEEWVRGREVKLKILNNEK